MVKTVLKPSEKKRGKARSVRAMRRPIKKRQTSGGWGEIRTLGTDEGTHAFQACAIDHSATHPKEGQLYQ